MQRGMKGKLMLILFSWLTMNSNSGNNNIQVQSLFYQLDF